MAPAAPGRPGGPGGGPGGGPAAVRTAAAPAAAAAVRVVPVAGAAPVVRTAAAARRSARWAWSRRRYGRRVRPPGRAPGARPQEQEAAASGVRQHVGAVDRRRAGSRAATARSLRLPRGASLSDFADKINANPASLVQVMFHLGEMVTATQSVNEDTLQLLGAELNYQVQVVSPEDEDRELLESFDLPSATTRAARTT